MTELGEKNFGPPSFWKMRAEEPEERLRRKQSRRRIFFTYSCLSQNVWHFLADFDCQGSEWCGLDFGVNRVNSAREGARTWGLAFFALRYKTQFRSDFDAILI